MYLMLLIQIQWRGTLILLLYKIYIIYLIFSGKLDEEDTWFELSPQQQVVFDNLQMGYKLIREQYHAIHDLLWLQGHMIEELPERYVLIHRHKKSSGHSTVSHNK